MRKLDARVRYTQRALRSALLALLRDKPLNRITVTEVCERAGLNRATFYYHYSDCFSLLDHIERELLDAFRALLESADPLDVAGIIESLYRMIGEHEEACRVLIFQGADKSLLPRMIDLARRGSRHSWRESLHLASDAEAEMLYLYLSNGLMHVIIEGYDKYRQEDVIRFVSTMAECSLSRFR